MNTYTEILNRHGLKMWGSFIVGSLATIIPMMIVVFIGVILFFLIGRSALIGLEHIDPLRHPEELFKAFINPGTILIGLGFFAFLILVSLLASAFTSAGSVGVVSEAILENRSAVGTYFRYGFRRLFPMLGLHIVLFLLTIPPIIPFIIGIFFFATEKIWGVLFGIISMLLTIIAYLAYALIVMHAPTALIAHSKGVFESISDSFNAFYKKFGQVLLSGVILFGISIIGGMISLMLEWLFVGVNPFDVTAESNPFRSFLSLFLMFPVNIALQMIVTFTLAFRYLRVIHPAPPPGEPPVPETVPVGPSDPFAPEGSSAKNESNPPYSKP